MNITITQKGPYVEVAQPNPLRWMIVTPTEDGGFKNETGWLKCRDFFNDYVYARHTGKTFAIYGFDTSKINVAPKDQPMYMLLDVCTQYFQHNLEVLNIWLLSQDLPQIEFEHYKDKMWLIALDPLYLESTHHVSLITLFIRLMNQEFEFQDFDAVLTYNKFPYTEQEKLDKIKAKGLFFNLPEKVNGHIWYTGPDYNSKKTPDIGYGMSSTVHNNGVLGWLYGL